MPKTTLMPAEIRSALRARLGPISELCPLTEGEVSQVFAFRVGGDELVVRVAGSRHEYDKERYVVENLRPAGVPVPDIADIWHHDDAHVMCVSRRFAGMTVDRVSAEQAADLIEPVLRAHSAITAVDISATTGFGTFDAVGRADHSSWPDYLAAAACEPLAAPSSHRGRVESLEATLIELAPECPNLRHLVHADFGGNNLLTDGATVTGVIDWPQALFGDPMYDAAWSIFWGGMHEPMRVHGNALWSAWADTPRASIRLLCCIIHVGFGAARYFLREGRDATAVSVIDRTAELAERLSRPSP
ncbi:MAG TPA: aminoglycoside phosphotransferase family protein [Jiangellaceae bacterium]